MKITGKILTQKTMAEMKVGESGFLDWNAITLINRKYILINPNCMVSPYPTEYCAVPITRTNKGPEDYEIHLFINKTFFNAILPEEEVETFKNTYKQMGPYDVSIEIDENDQNQRYPRMTWDELIQVFIAFNKPLIEEELDEEERKLLIENKKNVITYMSQHINNMDLEIAECYKNMFKEINNPDEPDLYNMCQDKEMDIVITKRIKSLKKQQTYEEMSVEDLKIKMQACLAQENFEKADVIKQIISQKQKIHKQ